MDKENKKDVAEFLDKNIEKPISGGLITGCPYCHGEEVVKVLGGPDRQCICKEPVLKGGKRK